MSYPADCLASNVPPSGAVTITAPRIEITSTKADNWCPPHYPHTTHHAPHTTHHAPRPILPRGCRCPVNKNYIGNVTMVGGGAFGKQYAYSHNQADHYLTKVH